jgi:hypothetical protein
VRGGGRGWAHTLASLATSLTASLTASLVSSLGAGVCCAAGVAVDAPVVVDCGVGAVASSVSHRVDSIVHKENACLSLGNDTSPDQHHVLS